MRNLCSVLGGVCRAVLRGLKSTQDPAQILCHVLRSHFSTTDPRTARLSVVGAE